MKKGMVLMFAMLLMLCIGKVGQADVFYSDQGELHANVVGDQVTIWWAGIADIRETHQYKTDGKDSEWIASHQPYDYGNGRLAVTYNVYKGDRFQLVNVAGEFMFLSPEVKKSNYFPVRFFGVSIDCGTKCGGEDCGCALQVSKCAVAGPYPSNVRVEETVAAPEYRAPIETTPPSAKYTAAPVAKSSSNTIKQEVVIVRQKVEKIDKSLGDIDMKNPVGERTVQETVHKDLAIDKDTNKRVQNIENAVITPGFWAKFWDWKWLALVILLVILLVRTFTRRTSWHNTGGAGGGGHDHSC